jgi:hypothetical protein
MMCPKGKLVIIGGAVDMGSNVSVVGAYHAARLY